MKGGKPFMKYGLEQINEVVEKIAMEKLPHKNCVIIGDNSSGKSLLLKKFIEKVKGSNNIYFIDAVNRGFDVKKVSNSDAKIEYNTTILDTRIEDYYFNLNDSFNCFGTLTERVEMIYKIYENDVQNLFYKFTGDKFNILYGEPLGEVEFANGRGLLSSGYQAIIRVFLELLFYQDTRIIKKNINESWVVIDEIDEFLSPKYAASILEFLKQEFPWGKWIVTTHSCDLVAYSSNSNLVVLDNNCEVIDIDDYSSVSEVQIIFERIFGSAKEEENRIEKDLRRLLNNKINGAWSKKDDVSLKKLQNEKLSASQKMILKQVQEW